MLSPNFQTRALKFHCRNSRGSVITPVIADAATVAGDPMKMRALGSPMRPLKLRVVAVMQVSFGPQHAHMAAAAGAAGRRRHHRAGVDQQFGDEAERGPLRGRCSAIPASR